MKTTLPKKSQPHQGIIDGIVEAIKQTGKKKIAYIILFGSHARGDHYETEIKQESDGSYLQYISDYDFLILTSSHKPVVGSAAIDLEIRIKQEIEKRLLDKEKPVSLIIETLSRVNKDLKKGHYFFSDIKKEGILLYKSEKAKSLAEAKELTAEEMRELAKEYYEEYMEYAEEFFVLFKYSMNSQFYKKTAFMLHQATENLYSCAHLVFTNYRPRIHDIEKLNKPLLYYSEEFLNIFPKDTKEKEDCFDLLKRAYVEARYNRDYSISKEQLEYLMKRVEKLREVVKKVCEEKINSF